jgi:hypothetical protein
MANPPQVSLKDNMIYLLVFLAGVLLSVLIVAVMIYFKSQIVTQTRVVERWLETNGPKPSGGIFLPEDEADITRKEIIERNRKQGKDTPISELL